MDFCAPLALIAVGLFLFAAIGHGLWLVIASFFEAIFGDPRRRKETGRSRPGRSSARQSCARCGTPFPEREAECPGCGLDPRGKLAAELRDIEVTAANIQTLVKSGVLEPAVGEQVYR